MRKIITIFFLIFTFILGFLSYFNTNYTNNLKTIESQIANVMMHK